MKSSDNQGSEFLSIKIIQSGDIIKVALTTANLRKRFSEIYSSLLKELKFKQKDIYLSTEDGKMISNSDLNLSLEDIIKKFSVKLKLYYEKVF